MNRIAAVSTYLGGMAGNPKQFFSRILEGNYPAIFTPAWFCMTALAASVLFSPLMPLPGSRATWLSPFLSLSRPEQERFLFVFNVEFLSSDPNTLITLTPNLSHPDQGAIIMLCAEWHDCLLEEVVFPEFFRAGLAGLVPKSIAPVGHRVEQVVGSDLADDVEIFLAARDAELAKAFQDQKRADVQTWSLYKTAWKLLFPLSILLSALPLHLLARQQQPVTVRSRTNTPLTPIRTFKQTLNVAYCVTGAWLVVIIPFAVAGHFIDTALPIPAVLYVCALCLMCAAAFIFLFKVFNYTHAITRGRFIAAASFGIVSFSAFASGLGYIISDKIVRAQLSKPYPALRAARDGERYFFGFGVPQNYAQAKRYLEIAAEMSNVHSMTDLGVMYANGYGVPVNYEVAQSWLRRAADAGDPEGMRNLGHLFVNGSGVSADYTKALEWYMNAASRGDAASMYNVGTFYDNGHAVPKNPATACAWYLKAAKLKNPDAMFNLGCHYDEGEGVAQNFRVAREWYERAAATGMADAMYNLALLYERGEGVPQDQAKALDWYKRAAPKGSREAKAKLGRP